MSRPDLEAQDLAKPHWGNFEANLLFLERTHLLTSRRQVLEIGSGKGHMLNQLYRQGHNVFGVDTDGQLVTESKRLYPELSALVATGTALPFSDRTFDLVLSFDVLEHIPESDLHLAEVRRILRDDGFYVLQTPNKWTNVLFESLRFARKYGIRDMFSFLQFPHHCALHNYWQLIRRFDRNGFDLRYCDVPVVNAFFRDKLKRFLGTPGVWALRVCNPDSLPRPFRPNLFAMAAKRPVHASR